ncbi:MAG: hypothetical protein K6G48_07405 [Acholeplasmatales bacterium]|nr:hypothetical protein [Acholeplasmatales bacterium]
MSDNVNSECPNCGAMMDVHDKCCKYCGSANPNYKAPYYAKANDLNNVIKNSTDELKKADINIVVLVLLFIFCWPAAVVYLIVKMSK